jgi:photosystem II stability/assembly factor-like uncharacterized protein
LAQWTELTVDTLSYNNSVFFINLDTGFIVTLDGEIYRTYDKGNSWNVFDVETDALWDSNYTPWSLSLLSIDFPKNSVGYIGAQDGNVFMTRDFGNSWKFMPNAVPWNDDINDIHFINIDSGYAVAASGKFVTRTFNSSKSWQSQIIDRFYSIIFINDSIGLVSGEGIFRTDDYGNTWIRQNADSTKTYFSVFMLNSINGIAVGKKGSVIFTKDGGKNWSPNNNISKYDLKSVVFLNDSIGFAVGGITFPKFEPVGVILITTDGGKSWSEDSIANGLLTKIIILEDSTVITVGFGGHVLKSSINALLNITGINELSNNKISLYPNPAFDVLNIDLFGYLITNSTLKLFDIKGAMVITSQITSKNIQIDISRLKPGMYFGSLLLENKQLYFKFIKSPD